MSTYINKISEGERIFITNGIDINIRSDGRSCNDHRLVMIEQNVIQTCSGSAHARSGNTDVLVGIKLELEEINNNDNYSGSGGVDQHSGNNNDNDDNNTNKGRVQVFADISAIASPAFEGKKGEDITCQIETLFSEFLPDYLDLEKLVIVPGKSYFVLHVDIVILECSSLSSLIDITSIAIKTALYDVRIPKVNILSVDQNEFTVSEDEFEAIPLDASQVPLVTSYAKIGSKFVVDATWEEEQASVGTVSVAFVPPDQIVMIKKIRHGSITTDSFSLLYKSAISFGQELYKKFNEKIQQNISLKKNGKITFSLN